MRKILETKLSRHKLIKVAIDEQYLYSYAKTPSKLKKKRNRITYMKMKKFVTIHKGRHSTGNINNFYATRTEAEEQLSKVYRFRLFVFFLFVSLGFFNDFTVYRI